MRSTRRSSRRNSRRRSTRRHTASGASSDTLTYTYTNNNQLTGVSHTNGSFSNESFTWDSNGNETGTGYTTGTDNEQTASPGYTYTYDNAGEMTSETQTSTGDVWTYGYDLRGRMVTAVEKKLGRHDARVGDVHLPQLRRNQRIGSARAAARRVMGASWPSGRGIVPRRFGALVPIPELRPGPA